MHSLLYCSMATREMLEADILDLLKVARDKNARLEVSGLLVYQKRTNEFLQILEGEKNVIFDLLETIKADDRHKRLHVIHDQEIPERGFKGWSMAFANMESIDKSKLEGISDFLEKGYTHELAKADPTWAAQIMQTFQDGLPSE
jgi:hypothetical protein